MSCFDHEFTEGAGALFFFFFYFRQQITLGAGTLKVVQ
jgi:hypothetical protein